MTAMTYVLLAPGFSHDCCQSMSYSIFITILICDGPERRGRPAGHPAFLQHEAATQPEDHGKCAVSACFGILCSLDSLDYRSL